MAIKSCGDQLTTDGWCPQTIDDVMSDIYGLLPPGPAWAAAQYAGTVMHAFWFSVGNFLLWVYTLICAYVPEFFCNTASQSLDQWYTEYGIGADPCDPYAYNLCAKVTALGGQTCADFVALAAANGWVIDCAPVPDAAIGCMQIGAFRIGPPAVLASQFSGNNYTTDPLGSFESGNSQLGPPPEPVNDCGQVPSFPANAYDSTGNFIAWGNFYAWQVTVHVNASYALQRASKAPNLRSIGDWQIGCTPVDPNTALPLQICFLEEIAPAHTVLNVVVVQ